MKRFLFPFGFGLAALAILSQATAAESVLRVGHFPNITHAQPLVARAMAREGKPWFEPRLGPGWRVEWYVYNAGPAAMEAVFAKSIDLAYVGPNPAINAHVRSAGGEVRIIAGSAQGGAALVVRKESPLKSAADFRGKRLATPQLGNTQDVAARAWLAAGGLRINPAGGGDAFVIPTANPDQLDLFVRGQFDGVWTVEPWVSRLEREAGGQALLEQPDEVTTLLAARTQFLAERRGVAKRFVAAHAELTSWIIANSAETQRLLRAELKEITRTALDAPLLEQALRRLRFSAVIPREPLHRLAEDARKAGFLRGNADLSKFVEEP